MRWGWGWGGEIWWKVVSWGWGWGNDNSLLPPFPTLMRWGCVEGQGMDLSHCPQYSSLWSIIAPHEMVILPSHPTLMGGGGGCSPFLPPKKTLTGNIYCPSWDVHWDKCVCVGGGGGGVSFSHLSPATLMVEKYHPYWYVYYPHPPYPHEIQGSSGGEMCFPHFPLLASWRRNITPHEMLIILPSLSSRDLMRVGRLGTMNISWVTIFLHPEGTRGKMGKNHSNPLKKIHTLLSQWKFHEGQYIPPMKFGDGGGDNAHLMRVGVKISSSLIVFPLLPLPTLMRFPHFPMNVYSRERMRTNKWYLTHYYPIS